MEEKQRMQLGSVLRKLRIDNKLTLAQVAEKIGKTTKTVQLYETTTTNISLDVFIELCKIYHVTPDEVLKIAGI